MLLSISVDCRVIFCAQPTCSNPVTPPGRCCPVCPTTPDPGKWFKFVTNYNSIVTNLENVVHWVLKVWGFKKDFKLNSTTCQLQIVQLFSVSNQHVIILLSLLENVVLFVQLLHRHQQLLLDHLVSSIYNKISNERNSYHEGHILYASQFTEQLANIMLHRHNYDYHTLLPTLHGKGNYTIDLVKLLYWMLFSCRLWKNSMLSSKLSKSKATRTWRVLPILSWRLVLKLNLNFFVSLNLFFPFWFLM